MLRMLPCQEGRRIRSSCDICHYSDCFPFNILSNSYICWLVIEQLFPFQSSFTRNIFLIWLVISDIFHWAQFVTEFRTAASAVTRAPNSSYVKVRSWRRENITRNLDDMLGISWNPHESSYLIMSYHVFMYLETHLFHPFPDCVCWQIRTRHPWRWQAVGDTEESGAGRPGALMMAAMLFMDVSGISGCFMVKTVTTVTIIIISSYQSYQGLVKFSGGYELPWLVNPLRLLNFVQDLNRP